MRDPVIRPGGTQDVLNIVSAAERAALPKTFRVIQETGDTHHAFARCDFARPLCGHIGDANDIVLLGRL